MYLRVAVVPIALVSALVSAAMLSGCAKPRAEQPRALEQSPVINAEAVAPSPSPTPPPAVPRQIREPPPAQATQVPALAPQRSRTRRPDPYPGDGSNGPDALEHSGIVRTDVRSSFGGSSGVAEGVPMTLELTIQDLANGGALFAGTAADRAGPADRAPPAARRRAELPCEQSAAESRLVSDGRYRSGDLNNIVR